MTMIATATNKPAKSAFSPKTLLRQRSTIVRSFPLSFFCDDVMASIIRPSQQMIQHIGNDKLPLAFF